MPCTRAPRGRTWLVDPLCGTLNFAAGSPSFCVNVALVDAGVTVAAAVSHPPTGELYWSAGQEFGVLGRRSTEPPAPNRLVDINADGPLDRPFVGAQLAADPDFRAVFNPRIESTTLALAWVASGQRLGYVTDGRLEGSVHFAAGIALCQRSRLRHHRLRRQRRAHRPRARRRARPRVPRDVAGAGRAAPVGLSGPGSARTHVATLRA